LGILSIPCCGFVIFGIGAAVTGFLAKKKADQNPELYGGRGMALAGMIIGIITAVIGLILNGSANIFRRFEQSGKYVNDIS
jgi:Na+/proline symporter